MVESETNPRDVSPTEAARLVDAGDVRVVDVRSPGEYQSLGHIQGALLLPVDLFAAAPAVLPRDDMPLLLVCEHGVRSAYAAGLLAQVGYNHVLNMTGGMSCWSGSREQTAAGPGSFLGPAAWLLSCGDLLPAGGSEALDVACGRGRHALLLAGAGLKVHAVDANATKIAELQETARSLGVSVRAEQLDLEAADTELPLAAYDLVLGINYLHRPLFPALVRAVKPGGLLIWETFTAEQATRGNPTNRDFLLEPGELSGLVAPLEVLREREGDHEGRFVASVAARAPAAG